MPYPYKSLAEWFADEEALGNVRRFTAPIKCGDYDEIVEIGNGIPGKQPKTEIRALVRYLHTLPGYTGFKNYGEQVMIDGTIKVPERFETFPPRAEPLGWEKAAVADMRRRLE